MPRAILVPLLLMLAMPALAQAPQQPRDRSISVANETDRPLQQLFVHRAGARDPGPDRLSPHALPPRATLRVPLGRTAACAFEVRAVFEEGEVMHRPVDACRAARVTLTEAGPWREVEIANDTDLDLHGLHVWPSGAEGRGHDRLGATLIPAGESLRLRLHGLRGCVFDLAATFMDGSEETRERADLCRTPRLGFGDPSLPVREVPVLNRARRTIRELYAAPHGRAERGAWGPDRLGLSLLDPRGSVRLRVRARDCVFDLRAVYEDNRTESRRGVDLCVVQGVVFGDRPLPPPRRLLLVNAHLRPVQQLYLSPSEVEEWGEELLEGDILATGARQEVEVEGECLADLRIVFDTGAAEERRDVDLCAVAGITLRPGWTVEDPLAAPPP